ncbi:ubiquitin-ubiquitin ligase BUL1 KNAG_0J00300 [Huiozyma naganishii CBS 8797]|uniref:BUL2 n=1 Tax=Huiozyma naganishii (strain ATCC MYA-139 / BCRC 22969 / CBS 8797 / KCTC 17520 / NBRC 10181 / NCYC 3082 / Yp74L-3) TaxID=1071383 RepID=J7RQP0_HUIN7|nr:hypothetical protein KNAG_0J00300 [Kazachstania naganishii CBS 8797]CCK72113.1 hypothetical protein KNAG_0J00300 [Kazachstania naganishii CBS 8797]
MLIGESPIAAGASERPALRSAVSSTQESRSRGRQRGGAAATAAGPPTGAKTSWIRSASTSSLRRLQRGPPHAHAGPHTPGSNTSGAANPQLLVTRSHISQSPRPKDVEISEMGPLPPSLAPWGGYADMIDHPKQDEQRHGHTHAHVQGAVNGGDYDDYDESLVLDVLPSFEMYNALHRHIPQGNVNPDRHDFPPTYGEAAELQKGRGGSSGSSSRVGIAGDPAGLSRTLLPTTAPTLSMESTINSLRPLSTQHMQIGMPEGTSVGPGNGGSIRGLPARSVSEDMIQDDVNENDNIAIDKLYTLPKKATPINIDIKITKHASLPPQKPEDESILKEYTSGSLLHGYCTIENKGTVPLKFEMFYVTLEAYTSVIDKQRGKRTVKRFLRMVDLSASWSYTNIDLGTGFRMLPGSVDYDNTILGLNNNRILEPGTKYKKFFVFKLPRQLLDVTCKQQHFAHCLLPPSFGIDKYRNNCKYSGIKVNNVLGCGHLGSKGSPILTLDHVDDDLSVNYTVDARIVGKDMKTQMLNIMKEREYNIRFIPFGFHSSSVGERDPSRQLRDIMLLIEERLSALKKVFQRLEKNEPIKNSDINGTELAGTLEEDTVALDTRGILERKMNQLQLQNNNTLTQRTASPFDDIEKSEPREPLVESELNYRLKSKSSSKIGLFSGFRSNSSQTLSSANGSTTGGSTASMEKPRKTDKSGLILVASKIPVNSLPYWSPSLLRKTNKFEKQTRSAQENWERMRNSITEEEKTPLKNLTLNLTCLQSNNSMEHEPPQIQSVTTELVIVTGMSENSVPIRLNASLLMNSDKIHNISEQFRVYLDKIESYAVKFRENRDKLNELYNKNSRITQQRILQFTDFIPSSMYNNVESLSNLKVKVQTLGHVFKKQTDTLRDDYISPTASKTSLQGLGGGGGSGSGSNSGSNTPHLPHVKQPTSAKFAEQIVRQWVKKADAHFEREINVNLEYNTNLVETLVPSFESCLCCRFYCVQVHIKFHHAGSVELKIPVTVRHFEC